MGGLHCLAKYGLFSECCEALKVKSTKIEELKKATPDAKATYIQGEVSKTDFAYDMADILKKQLVDKVQESLETSYDAQKNNPDEIEAVKSIAATEFSLELKKKLPSYIVEAIEYVTSPIVGVEPINEQGND